jgi:response regulator RpfG family c-di-GMP phosphodiesterase
MSEPRLTLLAVDDEPENLDLIERVFKGEFDVVRASNGAEALALCAKHRFSVIISDQRMPEMTGVELLQKTLDLQPDCIRIVLTAYDDREIVVGALNLARAYRFFSKPFDVREMQDAVRAAVHNQHLERENRRLLDELKVRNEALEKNRADLVKYSLLLKEYSRLLQEIDQDAQ